ncbi:MAG: bifunctional adenosylcobinamide kinase/adenosylcobinamide-phosphate guanylyltransferase [Cyanobacteria bacterium P01_H01_bin.105]
MPQLILVTGPARSGKSEWAEYWAEQTNRPVVYVATSTVSVNDTEWQRRVAQHRERRPTNWKTLEVPKDLAKTIQTADANRCLLVDSLGTWLTNQLNEDDASWQVIVDELVTALKLSKCDVILVAEETGWGVVPAYPLGRTFRDRLGYLVRCIGEIATQVYLITGGYALDLKRLGKPLPPTF